MRATKRLECRAAACTSFRTVFMAIFITSGVASARRLSFLIATSAPVARSIARCTAPNPPVAERAEDQEARALGVARADPVARRELGDHLVLPEAECGGAHRVGHRRELPRLGPLQRLDHAALGLVALAEFGERAGEHDAGIELVARQVVIDEAFERILERIDRVLRVALPVEEALDQVLLVDLVG